MLGFLFVQRLSFTLAQSSMIHCLLEPYHWAGDSSILPWDLEAGCRILSPADNVWAIVCLCGQCRPFSLLWEHLGGFFLFDKRRYKWTAFIPIKGRVMNMHPHACIQLILVCADFPLYYLWFLDRLSNPAECTMSQRGHPISSSSKTRNLWLPPVPPPRHIATLLILNKLPKDMRNMLGNRKSHNLRRVSKY